VRVGGFALPVGLILVAITLFTAALINLCTKQTATISGLIFTGGFFAVFVVSERITQRRRASGTSRLDQFQVSAEREVGVEELQCRPGNVLVPVRDYNTLQHFDWVFDQEEFNDRDVVVLTIRLLRGPDGGPHSLEHDELFTDYEQMLFTRVVAIAERHG